MTHILPIRSGWMPDPGQDDLYPPDLPEHWQLTYLANEALGVLVPEETWCSADGAELDRWREETPARFRFYLEVSATTVDDSRAVATCIGARFGGLVGEAGEVAVDWLYDAQRWVLVQPGALTSLAVGSSGIAVRCPPELVEDLAGARRWVESLTRAIGGSGSESPRRAILCLLGPCRLDDLGRWQALAELMGLSF